MIIRQYTLIYLRVTKENKTQQVGRVPQSPSLQRREVKNKDKLPLSAPRTPSSRRKVESESNSKSTKDGGNRRVGLVRFVYVFFIGITR